MARRWSKRMLAVGGLVVAIGCRSTTPEAPPYAGTPLLPGDGSTVVSGPVQGTSPIVAAGPLTTPPILPPGAIGPQSAPYALVRPVLPTPSTPAPGAVLPAPRELAQGPAASDTPTLPAIVAPADIAKAEATKLASNPPEIPPTPSNVPGPSLAPTKGADKDTFTRAARTVTPPDGPLIIKAPVEETRPAEQSTFPLQPGQQFGHDADYRWVAGVLDYHQRGGYWTVRYADFAADDRWGGKVRLVDDARLRDCKAGDIVYISGELLAPVTSASAESRTTFPPFRIGELKVIQKAK